MTTRAPISITLPAVIMAGLAAASPTSLSATAVATFRASGDVVLSASTSLSGSAAASVVAQGDVVLTQSVSGSATANATASGDIVAVQSIAGTATATFVASGFVTISQSIAGTAMASASASGSIAPPFTTVAPTANWAQMRDQNAASMAATFGVTQATLSDRLRAEVDSLTEGDTGGGNTPADIWTARLAENIGSAIDVSAVSGNTTGDGLTRFQGFDADQLDDFLLYTGGTNDIGQISGSAVATVQSNMTQTFALLGHNRFAVSPPLIASAHALGQNGVDEIELRRWILETYYPRTFDMQMLNALGVADSALAADILDAQTGDIIASRSDDGLHPDVAGNADYVVSASFLAIALDDQTGYSPDTPPVRILPSDAEGTAIIAPGLVGRADNWQIGGGNADNAFAINPTTGAITRGPGAWSEAGGVRDMFIATQRSGQDDIFRNRVPVAEGVADGDYSKTVRWGVCTEIVRDQMPASVDQFTAMIICDYDTPGTSRKTWFTSEVGVCSGNIGSSTRNIGFKKAGNSTVAVRNFATWTGMNVLMLSYDATADGGAGRYWFTQQNSGGQGPAFNAGGALDLSGIFSLGAPFGSTYDPLDLVLFGFWEGVWEVDQAAQRDKFFDSTTFAPTIPADGIIDGVAPSILKYGGPGDHLMTFDGSQLSVNNRGSIPGTAFNQMPYFLPEHAGYNFV